MNLPPILVAHWEAPDDWIYLCLSWLNDPVLMRFSEQRHKKHTFASQRYYLRDIEGGQGHFWYIVDNKEPIGTITAKIDIPNSVADVGILVAKSGQGYGTAAWRMVCSYLFSSGIRKIEAGCMASNAGMIKILTNCGFSPEGVRRGHFLLDDSPQDLVLYGRFPWESKLNVSSPEKPTLGSSATNKNSRPKLTRSLMSSRT